MHLAFVSVRVIRPYSFSLCLCLFQVAQAISQFRDLFENEKQLACTHISIDSLSLVFKMYPKKLVDIVAAHRKWKVEDVPRKMTRRILSTIHTNGVPHANNNEDDNGRNSRSGRSGSSRSDDRLQGLGPTADSHGYCLDYERRDVVKHVLSVAFPACVVCGAENDDPSDPSVPSRDANAHAHAHAHLAVKLRRCSQCRIVQYCSKACQRRDWPAHKVLCENITEGMVMVPRAVWLEIFSW